MSWHYACVPIDIWDDGDIEYQLVEAYPNIEPATTGIVPHIVVREVIASSPKELANLLRRAADDIDKYGSI